MDFKKLLPVLVVLLAVVSIAVWFVLYAPGGPSSSPQVFDAERIIAEGQGFDLIVSYTDTGFEPSEPTIEKGQSIRFVNNSSHDLHVMGVESTDNIHYPGVSGCSERALDSCFTLKPQEFWEFTFAEVGTWLFRNETTIEHIGAVYVIEEQDI